MEPGVIFLPFAPHSAFVIRLKAITYSQGQRMVRGIHQGHDLHELEILDSG